MGGYGRFRCQWVNSVDNTRLACYTLSLRAQTQQWSISQLPIDFEFWLVDFAHLLAILLVNPDHLLASWLLGSEVRFEPCHRCYTTVSLKTYPLHLNAKYFTEFGLCTNSDSWLFSYSVDYCLFCSPPNVDMKRAEFLRKLPHYSKCCKFGGGQDKGLTFNY